MPFVKVIWEAAHGIPPGAFFWARLDGTRQRLGFFMVGGGLKYVVPMLSFGIAADTDRGRYPSTIGDLAAGLLSRRVAPDAPLVVGAVLVGVGAARIGVRLVGWIRGEGARARLRAEARPLGVRRVGRRDVEIFVSPAHAGAPFTGGLLRPYVCFPEATFDALSPAERAACLAHELAHIAHLDLLFAAALDLLGDVLWFLPGRAAVRRRIDASCERLADLAAERAGASPLDLATALVRSARAARRDPRPRVGPRAPALAARPAHRRAPRPRAAPALGPPEALGERPAHGLGRGLRDRLDALRSPLTAEGRGGVAAARSKLLRA